MLMVLWFLLLLFLSQSSKFPFLSFLTIISRWSFLNSIRNWDILCFLKIENYLIWKSWKGWRISLWINVLLAYIYFFIEEDFQGSMPRVQYVSILDTHHSYVTDYGMFSTMHWSIYLRSLFVDMLYAFVLYEIHVMQAIRRSRESKFKGAMEIRNWIISRQGSLGTHHWYQEKVHLVCFILAFLKFRSQQALL